MSAEDPKVGNCIVCGDPTQPGHLTCSNLCHEALVLDIERRFGTHKKVVRMTTGVAYRVPVRDIIERGLKERELDQYPVWPDDEEAANLERGGS